MQHIEECKYLNGEIGWVRLAPAGSQLQSA